MMRTKSKRKEKLDPALLKKLGDYGCTRLDLKGFKIVDSQLPFLDLPKYQSLVWLNLPSNHLCDFPVQICELPFLKTLRLSANYISSIPPQITHLTSLTLLDLSKNDIKSFGPELGCLMSLVDLNLHWNGLQTLSSALNNLTQLRILNVSLNCISSFPTLNNCKKLENVDLSHNWLKSIPNSFFSTSLYSLNFAGNRISDANTEHIFPNLVSVSCFDLQNNELREVPRGLTEMPILKYLRLRGNQLRSLPDSISRLTCLEELEVSNNFLERLPQGISNLTRLAALLAYQNFISELPPDLGVMATREFGFAYNRLKTISLSKGGWAKMISFYLQNNSMQAIDSTVFMNMNECQEVYLSNNKLSSLPATLGCLKDLRKLEAMSNKLTSFPSVNGLTYLQVLDLGNNKFSQLPPSIMKVTSLTHLNLFANKLSTVPEQISSLIVLKRLYLGNNRLNSLPKVFLLRWWQS
eukprot:TRINITY_DN9601_c0_g1_i6.p1 TRINITY_DN9601_c0_g1~~TRINITY_DN9601_c0_g1_i6.p1  ORF type:complete len:466 (-),score=63.64 TRINITY_DN9601_c0_g1_i6:820-2217(-)